MGSVIDRRSNRVKPLKQNICFASTVLLAAFAVISPSWGAEVLVEAEAFDEYGGWILNNIS